MDDGTSKCLLDVISDPNALQEFLRSNSQDNGSYSKNSTSDAVSMPGFGNHLLNTSSIVGTLPANARTFPVGSSTSVNNIQPSAAVQNTFVNTVVHNNSVARTSGSTPESCTVGVVPSSVPLSSGVNFLKPHSVENTGTKVGSAVLGMSVAPGSIAVSKPVVSSTGPLFQGKKPIPIQPKSPNASSAVTGSTIGSPGNRGRQVLNSGIPLVAQKQSVTGQQSVSTLGQHVALNGIDSKGNMKTNAVGGNFHSIKSLPPNNSQPILSSTTPVKRIAPKQPNILPQQTGLSPSHMVGTKQKIVLQQVSNQNTPQVQAVINQVPPGTVQKQNHAQLIQAQQLLNLIRGQTPTTHATQLIQSQSLPANQIKQIQQLVQQKLSNQQQQPQIAQTVQQKVLTPAQLQAALKQNQVVTTQTVQAPQPQNIVVQEEVIKQLLQQVSQQKSAQNLVQQQPQLFQHIQQSGQKQILVQNVPTQSTAQGQQNTQLQVNVSPQVRHSNLQQRTKLTAASPVNVQLQQVLNTQQKQVGQVLGQQQGNLLTHQNLVITKDQGARLLQGVTFVQNQPNKVSTAQVLNHGVVIQQAKPVLQQAKPGVTPMVQIAATTQPNTVSQTKALPAQNTGVQKVFIIKQPELLQKLGLQGTKSHQTIQITPQQLQALKQLQLQQQAAKQKLASNNLQTGSNIQPKGLTPEQLKQLQLQQQLQGSAVKQVVVQNQQHSLQSQRQASLKTQGKMQHIPRILQTSGRQPVSQSVRVSVPIKQETSKGVKRPHSSDAPEQPKAATRLKQGLTQDQQAVLRPDFKTPFTSREDVVKRLTPYHVCYDPSPTPEDIQKADGLYSSVSTQLVKRSQKMMEKYRQLLFDESMREHPSAEMVMLYRVFLTNERAALAEERKIAKENPMEIVNAAKKENTPKETSNRFTTSESSMKDLSSSEHSSPVVTSTTENDLVSSMKNTVSEASSKISSLLNINLSPPKKNSHTNSATSLKSGTSVSSLQLNSRHSPHTATSTENHISSSCTQEISTSNHSTVTKLMDNSNENHSLAETAAGESLSVSEDTSGDLLMDTDDEAEKEDVTATLALLNSMASELDEVLDVEGTL